MSRLIKAISELLQSPQGSPKRSRNPEPFSRSEFKKLIQQEFAPAKRPSSRRYRSIGTSEPDTEPMGTARAESRACVY